MTLDNETIEIYWVPGCSSCLRMKEFMERSGLPFTEFNLAVEPDRVAKLRALGVGAPAVVKGDRGVPGMDLVKIAELIGIDYDPPLILPAPELKVKYEIINAALRRFIALIPVEGLEYKSPDRDRSMRELAAHAGSAMEEFLHATEVDEYRYGNRDGNNAAFSARFAIGGQVGATGTIDDLIDYVASVGDKFEIWWDKFGFDDPLDRVVGTPWGHVTLLEILERAVWHTTQHTRQIEYFLGDRLGVLVTEPLTDEDLEGLPLPERVHA